MKHHFYHSLYFKMAAGLALILLVVGLSYTIFAYYMYQQITQSSRQLINQDLAQNLVNDRKIVRQGKIDIKAMKETFMQYMTINPSIEIYYLDLAGNILAYSAEPGKVKRNSVRLPPITQQLKQNASVPIPGDDPRSHDSKKPFSVTPIPDSDNPEGYLYVVLQSEQLSEAINKQSQNMTIHLGGIVITGSLFLGLLLGLYFFYRITRRLNKLQRMVFNYVANDFSGHIEPQKNLSQTRDEISELQNNIANMANHIQQQWGALKQQDTLRREMIANISHDLRTPLASVQGYLETITLKYSSLTDTQKKSYLETAKKQSKGLQTLIDGLLELAKLDAREKQPVMENFPLLELIYDVLNKFQIQTQSKNIQLNIHSESENPQVYADLGLIERVLDNLINNAIDYSPQNSTINIQIKAPEDGSLTIRVCDQGCGIDKSQQSLVFERFHQAHTPERTDGHAGLGLCIVKKIIELHQQKIWVESTPHEGAQFNFTLAST